MKKYIVLTGIISIMTISAAMTSLAAMTDQKAQDKAKEYVPSGSTYIKTEIDDGNYEVEYRSKNRQEKYKVTFSGTTEALLTFESERYADNGNGIVTLTEAKAKAVVTDELEDAEVLYTKLDAKDGEYEVHFKTDTYYGEYKIHGDNGTILERDIHMGKDPGAAAQGDIGPDKAKKIALDRVPGATVINCRLDYDDGRAIYKGTIYKDRWEYEFEIDAATGTILEWDQDYDD